MHAPPADFDLDDVHVQTLLTRARRITDTGTDIDDPPDDDASGEGFPQAEWLAAVIDRLHNAPAPITDEFVQDVISSTPVPKLHGA